MVDLRQAKGLITSLLRYGENLDPEDMSVLYGWIYSASVALQPFPAEHRAFSACCRESFDAPRERLNAGLNALREVLENPENESGFQQEIITVDYQKLLKKVLG
ncbi:MAG TPA: hypothetical protein VK463_02000 [Desulfomonilaceae bacterium]|nr:hypothetical protein [Desulfomonilaceae bacterium]